MEYRGYTINRNPKPGPSSDHDFDFVHNEYDWAPDGTDYRAGTAKTVGHAMEQIDEIEDEPTQG